MQKSNFLGSSSHSDLGSETPSQGILHGKIQPMLVGMIERRQLRCSGKFERKRMQPMLLLILNGEKADKSSWHNNACYDLAGKLSKRCSQFMILEDKKVWKKRIFFWNARFYLWKSQARRGDGKAVRLILSERALADYFPVLKWVSTNECSYQRKLCPVCFVGWRIVKIGVMAFVSQSLRVYCGGWKALTACDVSEARLINIDTGQGGKEAPISFCRKKLKRKFQNVPQYRKQL